jgi:hypothetical protein
VILTVYIDEAGTHDNSPITTMGGYVAQLDQWQIFDRVWPRFLERYGLTHLHTIDVLNGRGECQGWVQDQAIKFWTEESRLIANHTLFGFSSLVTDEDYREFYDVGERPRKIPLDTRYGLCFRLILNFIPQKVYETAPHEDVTLNFVLEAGAKNAGDAERIFQLFKRHAPQHLSKIVGTISFGEKRKHPGLQIADGVASSVFRLEKMPPEQPFYWPENVSDEPVEAGRQKVGGMAPVYRIQASAVILRELRDNIVSQIQARNEFGRRAKLLEQVERVGEI